MRFGQPNFIDIAETWSVGTSVWDNTIQEFSNQSRFWPSLKFARSVMNVLFTNTPQWYFFVFAIYLSLTVYTSLLILRHKKYIPSILVFASILLFISPVTVDTYWRLGAAETLFALMLVLSFYAMMKKKYIGVLVCLGIMMTTKESAVFYVPMYLFLLLKRKRTYESLVLGIGYALFLWKLSQLVNYAVTTDDYTSMMVRSFRDVADMVIHIVNEYGFYIIVLWSAFVLYLYRILGINNSNESKNVWGHYLFMLNIAGVCTLLSFHNKFQPYYAFPWVVTCIVWLSWELTHVSVLVQRIAIVLLSMLFIMMSVPYLTLLRMERWNKDYAGDNALIRLIEETKLSSSYTFARAYRPEYISALSFLSTFRKWPVNTKEHFTIFSNEEGRLYPDSKQVCGKTFLGASYCKWAVRLRSDQE